MACKKSPHSEPLADPTMQFAVIDYNGLNGAYRLFTAAPPLTQLEGHGSFAELQQLTIADFVDGTSQTIDVVETVNFGRGVWIHGRPHYNQDAYAINSLNGYNNAPNSVHPDGIEFAGWTGERHRRHVGDFELSPGRSERAFRRRVRAFSGRLPFGQHAHRAHYSGRKGSCPMAVSTPRKKGGDRNMT